MSAAKIGTSKKTCQKTVAEYPTNPVPMSKGSETTYSRVGLVQTEDYRWEDRHFPVWSSCVTISNLNLLSTSETWANPGIRSWKSTYLIEPNVRKPLVVFISQKKVMSWGSATWFRIWHFQTPALKRYLQIKGMQWGFKTRALIFESPPFAPCFRDLLPVAIHVDFT